MLSSKPAVAPTGQSSDAPAVRDAYRNYHIDAALSIAPGGKQTKASASLFAKTTTKEAVDAAVKTGTKEAAKSAARKIKEEVKDGIGDAPQTSLKVEVADEFKIDCSLFS